MVLFTTPDMDEILNAVERYNASGFYGVPTLYEYLKEYDKTDRVDWKRIKIIVCGADTLHESTVEGWERRTGSKITEGYGMTETAAVSHTNPLHRPKRGAFGSTHSQRNRGHHRGGRQGVHARGRGGGDGAQRSQHHAGLLAAAPRTTKRPCWSWRARPGCAPATW